MGWLLFFSHRNLDSLLRPSVNVWPSFSPSSLCVPSSPPPRWRGLQDNTRASAAPRRAGVCVWEGSCRRSSDVSAPRALDPLRQPRSSSSSSSSAYGGANKNVGKIVPEGVISVREESSFWHALRNVGQGAATTQLARSPPCQTPARHFLRRFPASPAPPCLLHILHMMLGSHPSLFVLVYQS